MIVDRLRGRATRVVAASFLLAAGLAAVPVVVAAQPQAQEDRAQLVITGARIHPAPGEPPIARGTIVVRDGKIAQVLTDQNAAAPPAERTIDAAGKTVTAGLWNSHVHFTEPKWVNAGALGEDALTRQLQDMVTSHGFTSVVDTGSDPANTLALRRRIEAGVAGPRIFLAGGSFVGAGGSPAYLEVELPEVTDPEQATRLTQEVLALGVDAIKIFTGSYVGQRPPVHLLLPVVEAVTAEAHAQKKWVVAHPQTLEGTQLAVDGGVDVLAHTAPQGGAWPTETIAAMVAAKMSVIPTLELWRFELTRAKLPPIAVDRAQATAVRQLQAFAAAGGDVLFGTDLGYMTDYDPTEEFQKMAEAGLTFEQILAALTTNPVRRWDGDAARGTVEVGKAADLVVLGTDPAQTIEGFADVEATVAGGKVVYQRAAR